MTVKRFWIATLAAAPLALVGCNSDDPVPAEEFHWQERNSFAPSEPAAECADFSSQLRIVDTMQQDATTFTQGEPILFDLAVTNESATLTHTLTTGSGPQVTFEVVDAQGRVVAGSHKGLAWVQIPVDYDYAPGENVRHQWVWNQTMVNGERAPAAAYTVYADERTQCRSALSQTRNFVIN